MSDKPEPDEMRELLRAIDTAGWTFRVLPCPSCKSDDTTFGSHDGGAARCKACGLRWTYGPLRAPAGNEEAVPVAHVTIEQDVDGTSYGLRWTTPTGADLPPGEYALYTHPAGDTQ